MDNKILITKDQMSELENELKFFIEVKRVEIIERIKEAKSFGDLSENSEYESAREEQAFIEAKIKELENTIKNSELISSKIDSDIVSLGNVVTYENIKNGAKSTYKIVAINANPLDSKNPTISIHSPIASSLVGKTKGEKVKIELPKGVIEVKITKIA